MIMIAGSSTSFTPATQYNNSDLFNSVASNSSTPKTYNFDNFCSSDSQNIRCYRLYIKKKYSQCKEIIQSILTQYDETLCEFQLILMSKIMREEAKLHESLMWLEKAQQNNPNSTKILYEVGKSHYLLSDHEKAIQFFVKAIERDPDDWKNYYWQSLAYYHLYRPPVCIQKAQEILISCPHLNKSADIFMFLARLLNEQNDTGAAADAYKHSIQLEPENVDLIHNLGMLYLKTKNEELAFATLGKALTYDQNYMPSILAIASILQNRGNFDVALSKYKMAATDFDHSCALWNNIGMCYYSKDRLVAAISCLNKANYLSPLDWQILFNLSLCYYSMRQFATAYHFASSAFSLYPQHPLILMTIALTLSKLGDLSNAKAAYERAYKLDENVFVVRLNYAIFEYKRGNVIDSIKLMGTTLLDITNGHEEINVLSNRLKKCFEKFANNNPDAEALLQRIYSNQKEKK